MRQITPHLRQKSIGNCPYRATFLAAVGEERYKSGLRPLHNSSLPELRSNSKAIHKAGALDYAWIPLEFLQKNSGNDASEELCNGLGLNIEKYETGNQP